MAHFVTGALVAAKDAQGVVHYLYQGTTLPSWVSKDDVARFRELKLVSGDAPVAQPEKTKPEGDAGPVEPPTQEVGEKPAGNASEEAWRAYAVTAGMSEDEANAKSRNELRDLYA